MDRLLSTAGRPGWLLRGALLLTALPALAGPARAQLALDGSGNVVIGLEQPIAQRRLHVQNGALNESAHVISAEYTGTGPYHIPAVYGRSIPMADWGAGGEFHGGWAGVVGRADFVGHGARFAVYGHASGGDWGNFGVWGMAAGDAGTKYGVWGMAHGAGTNYAGFFEGNVHVTGVLSHVSDGRFKRGVRGLDGLGVLGRLRRLEPSTYEYVEGAAAEGLHFGRGQRYGFVAQDVERVFPELVTAEVARSVGPEGPDGRRGAQREVSYRSVNYLDMVPLLVQAIQEQQAQIEALQARVDELTRALPGGGGNNGNGLGNQ